MERLQYTLGDSDSSIVFDESPLALTVHCPSIVHASLYMEHPNQPERDYQKDAHTDKGDNRIE